MEGENIRFASVHECGGVVVGTPMCAAFDEVLLFEAEELSSTRVDASLDELGSFVRTLIESSLLDTSKPPDHDPKRIDRIMLQMMGLEKPSEFNARARMVAVQERDGVFELQPVRNLGRGRFFADQSSDPPTTIGPASDRELGEAFLAALAHFEPPESA